VPVPTVIILIALGAVTIKAMVSRHSRYVGWWAFVSWAAAGLLAGISTISFIGILLWPFAVGAIVGASRLSVWPSGLGFVCGVGLVGVLVAALNFGESSSPSYYSWLVVGVVTAVAAAAAFTVASAAPSSSERGPRLG
jgi:hypothetical protein